MYSIDGGSFFGETHLLWWAFWMVFLFVIFNLLAPAHLTRHAKSFCRFSSVAMPLGEVSTAECEECKARIGRDTPADKT